MNNLGKKTMSFVWILDESKFLSYEDVNKLRETVRNTLKYRKKSKLAIRNWFLIELLLNTGLRVQEVADLKNSDLLIKGKQSSVIVRKGKGGRKRIVKINTRFKQDCKYFLKCKKQYYKDLDKEAPLFCNPKDHHLSKRTLQNAFKSIAKKAGISEHYSIHNLRHTYASFLLKASRNIRLVQKQLGHRSVTTTEVYADVFDQEIKNALENLYDDSY